VGSFPVSPIQILIGFRTVTGMKANELLMFGKEEWSFNYLQNKTSFYRLVALSGCRKSLQMNRRII